MARRLPRSSHLRFIFSIFLLLINSPIWSLSLPAPETLSPSPINLTNPIATTPWTQCISVPPDPFLPLSSSYCEITLAEMRMSFRQPLPFKKYWVPPSNLPRGISYIWQPPGSEGCRIVLKPRHKADTGYFSIQDVELVVRVILRRCQWHRIMGNPRWGYGGIGLVGQDGEGASGLESRIRRWGVYVFNASTEYNGDGKHRSLGVGHDDQPLSLNMTIPADIE